MGRREYLISKYKHREFIPNAYQNIQIMMRKPNYMQGITNTYSQHFSMKFKNLRIIIK